MFLVLMLAAALALAVWAWTSTRRPSWCPPGPPLVPWIGNLLSLDPARPERSYAAWAARYGPIYHVRLGALQQVVLSDPLLIREAFSRAEISARPDTAINTFIVDRSGLICSSGELWRETRRFTLHHLGSLGMGKTSLEPYIQRQVSAFMERVLEPSCGAPLSLDTPLNSAIINIIWRLVASEEVDITDDRMSGVLRRQGAIIGASARLVLLDTVPWLAPLLEPLLVDKKHIAAEFGALLEETFTPVLRRHRDTLPEDGDAPRDYMDAMLMEQRRRPELMTDWHMLMSVLHLFFAGSDTTHSHHAALGAGLPVPAAGRAAPAAGRAGRGGGPPAAADTGRPAAAALHRGRHPGDAATRRPAARAGTSPDHCAGHCGRLLPPRRCAGHRKRAGRPPQRALLRRAGPVPAREVHRRAGPVSAGQERDGVLSGSPPVSRREPGASRAISLPHCLPAEVLLLLAGGRPAGNGRGSQISSGQVSAAVQTRTRTTLTEKSRNVEHFGPLLVDRFHGPCQ